MSDVKGEMRGYRLLGIELISSALQDLKTNRMSKQTDMGKESDANKALDWFNKRSEECMGYGWALSVSGANPNVVRRSIIKLVGENKGKVAVK